MGEILVTAFVALDGVMQSPGGPEEDRRNGFSYGGWQTPYADAQMQDLITDEVEHPLRDHATDPDATAEQELAPLTEPELAGRGAKTGRFLH